MEDKASAWNFSASFGIHVTVFSNAQQDVLTGRRSLYIANSTVRAVVV